MVFRNVINYYRYNFETIIQNINIMNRKSVESSNLASVGYDVNSSILEVEFNNGGIYQYSNVPSRVYEGLMNADSHGSYFDKNVKKAGYSFRKIR